MTAINSNKHDDLTDFVADTIIFIYNLKFMEFVMKISDLKKDYPQIRFYELTEYPTTNIPLIKRIEDFLELTKIVGYKEFETS